MKLTKEYNDWYLELNKNCFIHTINDWSQIIGKYNWYSFHLIHIYFENDVMTGGYEFEFVIFGLGFRVRYNYSDKLEQLAKKLDKTNLNNINI